MFRKMRRFGQQVSQEVCDEILSTQCRGVLSVLGDDDYPYGLPIDYVYDKENGRLYFHGAKTGHKIDALNRHDKVSFCVWNEGFRREGEWALNITSVIVFGRIRQLEDEQEIREHLLQLALKYYPTREEAEAELEKDWKRAAVLELTAEHMTGKLVNES